MKTRRPSTLALLIASIALGCAGAPPSGSAPESPRPATPAKPAPAAEGEAPPPSGPARALNLPKPVWVELPSGLDLATLESPGLPIVQIRVVVLAGKSADGEKPGLAAITGDLLKDGGAGELSSKELLSRIESLGQSLSIDTGADKTVLGLAVTKDRMAEALALLATVVARPRFDQAEFGKLKKRELDRVADAARANGRWGATMVLWRDLFQLPADRHPYATYDAMPADIEKITAADCRSFHQKHYVPKNTFVVVAGDITHAAAKEAVEQAFVGYRGGEPPVVSFTDPTPPEGLRITLVHRPKSKQSDVFVGMLGPERTSEAWPAVAVANQVLGGGPAARLFLDIREKQSLAYTTRSTLSEVARGPVPFVAYAGTQTAKTGLAVKGLLEHFGRLGTSLPTQAEVDTASRYLVDTLAIRMETVGAMADEIVHLRTVGLPDDYYDEYRKAVRAVTPESGAIAAKEHVREGHALVVVAGDADKVGPMLSHFGEVKVVDPAKGFERIKTIPANKDAPLELPREAGE